MEKTMEMQNVLTHIRACENLCVVREFLLRLRLVEWVNARRTSVRKVCVKV